MATFKSGFAGLLAWSIHRLEHETCRAGAFIEHNIGRMIAAWTVLMVLGGGVKIHSLIDRHPRAATFERMVPLGIGYGIAAVAPLIGYLLVQKCFPRGAVHPQPGIRLAVLGRWTPRDPGPVHPGGRTGFGGLVVSIVAGLLLCMAMRLGEYYLAVPAIPTGAAPWATAYFWMMTFDLAFMSFLYSVAVTMALNAAPLFPRLLAYTWLCDVLMQVAIARTVVSAGQLPAEIVAPLQSFLVINIKKVLVSAAIWLPYLLLSTRINEAYRDRIRVPGPLFPRFA